MKYVLQAAMIGALAVASAATASFAQEKKAEDKVLETYDASTPLSTFDGGKVTLGDLIEARRRLGPAAGRLSDKEVYERLLEQIERRKLLAAAARKSGLDKDPAVAERVEAAVAAVLSRAYLEKEGATTATDAEAKALYDELAKTMPVVDETRTRHILVKTEAEAKAIKAEIDGGGNFALIAAAKSIGPSKTNGGDLGFVAKGQLVPAYEAAAAKLKPGEVSGPVKTRFGWHIIKLEARRKKRQTPPKFEQVKAVVTRMAVDRKAAAATEKVKPTLNAKRAEARPPYKAVNRVDLLKK